MLAGTVNGFVVLPTSPAAGDYPLDQAIVALSQGQRVKHFSGALGVAILSEMIEHSCSLLIVVCEMLALGLCTILARRHGKSFFLPFSGQRAAALAIYEELLEYELADEDFTLCEEEDVEKLSGACQSTMKVSCELQEKPWYLDGSQSQPELGAAACTVLWFG